MYLRLLRSLDTEFDMTAHQSWVTSGRPIRGVALNKDIADCREGLGAVEEGEKAGLRSSICQRNPNYGRVAALSAPLGVTGSDELSQGNGGDSGGSGGDGLLLATDCGRIADGEGLLPQLSNELDASQSRRPIPPPPSLSWPQGCDASAPGAL